MAIKLGDKDVEVPGIAKVYWGAQLVYPVPYLEIEPEVIWLIPWAENDVLSNTNWNVT